MSNKDLVERVGADEYYLQLKSPRDQRVLDAMQKVDREDFLPDMYVSFALIPYPVFERLRELVADFMVTYTKLGESKQAQEEVDKTLEQELYGQASRIIEHSRVLIYEGIETKINVKALAYDDKALAIGHDQTCSQPSLVGFMADILELEPRMKVLEVGSGSGYSAAITSHIIGKEGYLVTMEIIPELAELARTNLEVHFGGDVEERLEVICGDGSVGCKEHSPFDRIYLTAGVKASFNPEILEEQLKKDDGILSYPEERGSLILIKYKNGDREVEKYGNIVFVPLVGENA